LSIAIIINPVSGGGGDRGRVRAARAAAALEILGLESEVLLSERRGHARELAAAAVGRGARLLVAWGGDGTMNEVASALVGTPAALGLIPSGSGNGLARTLNIPNDPTQALAAACRAQPRLIDGGLCEGEWFFSVAGVGFDAHVAARFDRAGIEKRGLLTYVRVAVRDTLSYTPSRYTIDGVRTREPALLVTVANASQFGNGARIAPTAAVDDGLLDLVVVEERSRLASLLAVPWLFTGGIASVRGVSIRKVTNVVIEGDAPVPYHLDGEPKAPANRLGICVRPAVLRMAAS
jgi:diacylglycerol kinase (ATP)